MYLPSSDGHAKPSQIMEFIDTALASPLVYILGRDSRYEAFIFGVNHNATTYQAHFAVREDHRDGTVVKTVAEAGKWVFDNTECRSMIAFMREDNRGARSVLAQLGMKRVGLLKDSLYFDDEYHDELIYQGTVSDYSALWGAEAGEVT